ncbi:MAG: hypothetical protein M1828_005786 [Chrysothrix sp. TS-e1954]|nr:MAG: hypothetical protein M1828_005786 [Chrysothrix sp. TS-e1954]
MRRVARIANGELFGSLTATSTSAPSVCLLCQQRLLRRSYRTQNAPSNHRSYASDRPTILEQTRDRTGKRPEDQPVPLAVPAATREPSAEVQDGRDEDTITVGGDPDVAEEATTEREEAEAYEDQLRREEEELYQKSVDSAMKHNEYVPAETWQGLEEVGGETEKDEGETFTPYAGMNKLDSAEEVTIALHFALVEMFASRSSNIRPKEMTTEEVEEVDRLGEDIKLVKLTPGPNGVGATLRYPDGQTQERIQRLSTRIQPGLLPEELEPSATAEEGEALEENQTTLPLNEDELEAAVEAEVVNPAQLKKDVKNLGRAWLHIPLHNPDIKLDLARRVARLTGQHIPDHVLSRASSVGFILNELIRPPPPKKLFEALTGQGSQLPSLPNVNLVDHRLLMEDKERQIGRWKVIEQELRRRRLPVHHADVRAEKLA